MLRIMKVMDVVYNKVVSEDWDNVIIISGDEGIGKSTLGLHLFDNWFHRLLEGGKIKKINPEELINFVALGMDQFLYGFKEMSQFFCILYDEAGELSSLRMMNRFNFAVSKTYEVVRGDNLFSILVVPDIFYLNPFFSTRRARGHIHVYKRGKFAYWNKSKLRDMIQLNAGKKKKTPFRVVPLFYDTFPRYTGIFADLYKEKKATKISEIRMSLYDKLIVREQEKLELKKFIYNASLHRGKKITNKLLVQIFDMSEKTLISKRCEYAEQMKREAGMLSSE